MSAATADAAFSSELAAVAIKGCDAGQRGDLAPVEGALPLTRGVRLQGSENNNGVLDYMVCSSRGSD
jgi:hypothetical protein